MNRLLACGTAVLVGLGLATAGCSDKDELAPPAPVFDPVESPTLQTTQWVTGSAEYGATVKISGGVEDVTVTADPYTARFGTEILLMTNGSATTTLSATATDAAGNVSEVSTVDIVYNANPSIRIATVNGFVPCSDGTLQKVVSTDCSGANATTPAVTFRPNQTIKVVVNIDLQGNQRIAQVSLDALGFGVNATDTTYIGFNRQTPGTTLSTSFFFKINGNAFDGDALLVAEGTDFDGNVINSQAALLRIDLGLRGQGGSSVDVLVGAGFMNNPQGVAVASDGTIYVANADPIDSYIMAIERGTAGSFVSIFSTLPASPEDVLIAPNGNMYTSIRQNAAGNNIDEIWTVAADGTAKFYASANGRAGPLDYINTATHARGVVIWKKNTNAADGDLLDIEYVAGGSKQCYELNDITGGAPAGVCGNTCGGTDTDICVDFDSATSDGRQELADQINAAVNSLTEVSAMLLNDCQNNGQSGNGDPCLVLVHDTAGATPTSGLPLAVVYSGTNQGMVDVDMGEDASLLYAADAGNKQVDEFQAPTATGNRLNQYNPALNADGFAVVAQGADATTGIQDRLFIYTIDNGGNDEFGMYDIAADKTTIIDNRNGNLRQPRALALKGQCAIVSSDRRGEIYSYDLSQANPTQTLVATGFRNPRGLAFDGNGDLIVTDQGLNIVARVTPTGIGCF